MSTTNDGGPAFPIEGTGPQRGNPGMTLRDYFAGQANESDIKFYGDIVYGEVGIVNRAKARYAFADAMLAERSKS